MSENNGFFSRITSRLFGGYNTNTDRYTQPIQVIESANSKFSIFGIDDDEKNKQFITYCDNEFELYDTTPELQLVISKGASLFANGRWQVRKYSDDSIVEGHELIKLLEEPNPFQTRNEFLADLYTNMSLYGNCFTYKNYAINGVSEFPRTMVNLVTPNVALKRSGKYSRQVALDKIIEKYLIVDQCDRSKVIDRFDVDEVVHLKKTNPNDPLLGLSPLRSIHMPLTIIRSARGYIDADYRKKGALGVLSGGVNADGGFVPLSETDRISLERQYSEQTHGTADGQSKIMISNKPVEWKPFSSAIKDHVIHESLEVEFKKIIDCYGLNDALFSFLKQSTFNNQSNGERQAYDNSIIPFAESVSYAFTDALGLPDKGIYLTLDYSHVSALQEDEKEKAETTKIKSEAFSALVSNGVNPEDALMLAGFDTKSIKVTKVNTNEGV